jgi:hypothetical protein
VSYFQSFQDRETITSGKLEVEQYQIRPFSDGKAGGLKRIRRKF